MLLTERKKNRGYRGTIITVALFALAVLAFLTLLNAVSGKSELEQAAYLEKAIRRAVITCFAIEGRYPSSLKYLEDNYGLQPMLFHDQYIVSYTAYASNIFPDIAVLRVGVEQ